MMHYCFILVKLLTIWFQVESLALFGAVIFYIEKVDFVHIAISYIRLLIIIFLTRNNVIRSFMIFYYAFLN